MAANFKLQTTSVRTRRSPLTSLSWKSHRPNYTLQSTEHQSVRRNIMTRQHGNGTGDENEMSSSFSSRVNQLKAGATKTFESMRVKIDSLSQRFKRSTRRRYRLSSTSPYMPTPPPRSKRTPVKMYSPFCIETPKSKPRVSRTGTYTPKKTEFNSPTCRQDLATLGHGNKQFQCVAEKIVRASMRHKN